MTLNGYRFPLLFTLLYIGICIVAAMLGRQGFSGPAITYGLSYALAILLKAAAATGLIWVFLKKEHDFSFLAGIVAIFLCVNEVLTTILALLQKSLGS